MTTQTEAYVGIDVGKTWLDVAVWGQEGTQRVSNDEAGIGEIMTWVAELEPQLIVVGATGGYEQRLVQAMLVQGVPVAVANPTRVRALAKATGKLAKTGVIDAGLIAEYGFKIQPPVLAPKKAQEIRLKALDVEIEQLMGSLPAWQAQAERLDSIPGVCRITAVTVLAEMPELGQLGRQEIAALAGLAPFNRDSGKKRGKRRIFGGRKKVRRVLYMACLSAIKCNPVIRSFYQRLIQKGKLFKVAITACMRKMLTIMNAMTRDQLNWRPPEPISA
jgi:transposase